MQRKRKRNSSVEIMGLEFDVVTKNRDGYVNYECKSSTGKSTARSSITKSTIANRGISLSFNMALSQEWGLKAM